MRELHLLGEVGPASWAGGSVFRGSKVQLWMLQLRGQGVKRQGVSVRDLGVDDTVIWSLQLSELHIPYDASVAEGRWENIKKVSFF